MKNKTVSPLSLTYGSLFVALTAIGANITSIAPFMVVGGVPITFQTMFAILAGMVLGSRLGAFSMFVYMMLGLAGAPIFAQFKGGVSILISPTFGFIVSFIVIAYVVGKITEEKRTLSTFISASLVGLSINYIIGTNWMYAAYILWFEAPAGFTYKAAWLSMMVPLPKDIILSILGATIAYRLEKNTFIRRSLGKLKHTA